MPVGPAEVAATVRRLLGVEPDSVELVPTAGESVVYRVHRDGHVLYYKRDTDRVARWIESVVDDVPMARTIAFEQDGEHFVGITEEVPGAPMWPSMRNEGLPLEPMREVGMLIRRVHERRLPGAGFVTIGDDGQARGFSETWTAMMADVLEWSLGYLEPERVLEQQVVDGSRAAFGERRPMLDVITENRLLHADLRPDHVFTLDGRVTAIIDFQGRVGDPVFDFSKWALLTGRPGLDALLEGYEPDGAQVAALEERLDLYMLVEALAIVRWVHERDTASRNMLPHFAGFATEAVARLTR